MLYTTSAPSDPNPTDLARFMVATRQIENSGSYDWNPNGVGARGAYQILSTNWPVWAVAAGVNPADHSPAAQDRVAAHVMSSYWRSFQSWELVAEAWFAGPAAAAREQRNPGSTLGLSDGGNTVAQYRTKVLAAMGNPSTSTSTSTSTENPSGSPSSWSPSSTASQLADLYHFAELLTRWSTWERVLLVSGGGGLVLLGLSIIGADLSSAASIVKGSNP